MLESVGAFTYTISFLGSIFIMGVGEYCLWMWQNKINDFMQKGGYR